MDLYRILCAEWLKTKRTAIRWITFIIPVLYSVIFLYYARLSHSETLQFQICKNFVQIWSMLIVPIGVGLVSSLLIYEEELAGEFNGFLGSVMPRCYVYLGKFIMTLFLSFVSFFIALIILLLGMKFVIMPNEQIYLDVFIKAFLMVQIGTLTIIAIHLWISLAFGRGASIGLGGGGILIAAVIGYYGVGDKIWKLVPWTYSLRLSGYISTEIAQKQSDKSVLPLINVIQNDMHNGLSAALISFILLTFMGIMWFNKWEGRKIYD